MILCTGYSADWSIVSFVETSTSSTSGHGGPPMYRMYLDMFPPCYASQLCAARQTAARSARITVQLCRCAVGVAISNVFCGIEPLPAREDMKKHINEHQELIAERWLLDSPCDTRMVKQWEFREFQEFLHCAAGTGMENVGWG